MSKLQEYASKYINQISDNVYDVQLLPGGQLETFHRMIIDHKNELINQNFSFDLKDLALVRIMAIEDFPVNFEYRTLQEEGKFGTFINPFAVMLEYVRYTKDYGHVNVGCDKNEIETDKLKIEYPLFRSTKHFSLNGLASNVEQLFFHRQVLNNKPIIAIEPFKNHVGPNLVNINPVDTFYDVSIEPLKIGNDACIVMDYDSYQKLSANPQAKENLSKVKVFLYSITPDKLKGWATTNPQTVIADTVLSYLGYTPQHSINQSILRFESYLDDDRYESDKNYLKLFQDFMETLNNRMLGISYYHIPESAMIRRRAYNDDILNVPGVLHADTLYGETEHNANLNNIIVTIRNYVDFLRDNYGLDPSLANTVFNEYSAFMIEYYDSLTPRFAMIKHDKAIYEFFENNGYKKFLEATNQFNEMVRAKQSTDNKEEQAQL